MLVLVAGRSLFCIRTSTYYSKYAYGARRLRLRALYIFGGTTSALRNEESSTTTCATYGLPSTSTSSLCSATGDLAYLFLKMGCAAGDCWQNSNCS